MTWTITERDKKLLKFLAVFVLIVGVGFGIILPIQEKALEVKSDLADAQMIKQQRELEGMRLAGVQAELQEFLNGVADLEPAVRVSSFCWQRQEETLLQVSLLFYSIPEGE